MSRFTDLFQPKPVPAPVVEEKEVDVKSNKVVELSNWEGKKKK
jgi:hypothetical protein